jgi:hypothetical protein
VARHGAATVPLAVDPTAAVAIVAAVATGGDSTAAVSKVRPKSNLRS